MQRMKFLLLVAAILLSSGVLSAQNIEGRRHRIGKNRQLTTASLDLQTGILVRGPRIQKKALVPVTTAVSLDNLDFSGFLGIDSGQNGLNGPCEWISNADKSAARAGGKSTFISAFQFAYCSAVQDILSGGVGAAATISFFEGYIPGPPTMGGTQGTLVGSIALTGLPGSTGSTGFMGAGFASCRPILIQINLGTTPIVLGDTNFGYSYRFDGVDSGGILGGTAAFLGCVQSCSGTGPDGIGMIDNIDRFHQGIYASSFAFSTAAIPQPTTSVSFQLIEMDPVSTAATSFNGTGINTLTLATVSPPILGGMYSEGIDCTGFPTGKIASWRVGFVDRPAGPPLILGGGKGEVLVDLIPGQGLNLTVADHLGAFAAFGPVPVPLDLTFFGFDIFVQGFCGGVPPSDAGGTNLSNLLKRAAGNF